MLVVQPKQTAIVVVYCHRVDTVAYFDADDYLLPMLAQVAVADQHHATGHAR